MEIILPRGSDERFALTPHASLKASSEHIHVRFSSPHAFLSSAVLNGGLQQSAHFLNLKVDTAKPITHGPEQSLQIYAEEQGWQQPVVAMMTAASMDSCRIARMHCQGLDLAVVLTLGLSNAGRVGDPSGSEHIMLGSSEVGTINILFVTSANLTDTAKVEAVQMITEAKSAALQDCAIGSQYSQAIATGTGTDAVAVACLPEGKTVQYCGKHVLFGELLGRLVKEAMRASISWYGAS